MLTEKKHKADVIASTLLGAMVGVILGISLSSLHYEAVIKDLKAARVTSQHAFPLEREAICMEDRTVSIITTNAPYKQHQCVWVNKEGVVCDSCKDAMMYMILDTIPSIK